MNELATIETTSLSGVMEYARSVAGAQMLPVAYRNKPADIMLAVGLGQSMGLSPAEALYRINVINGKPAASAELIAANVRKAGHKLRVTGDADSATATIIRADDPDFEFTVTRDIEWAKAMKLDKNDNYIKQRATMLQWRAISAVARLACPEALYGVAYTPDEMLDSPTAKRDSGLASVIARRSEPHSEHEPLLLNTRSDLAKAMYAAINDLGIADDERIPFIVSVIDRPIESTKELTEDEARLILRHIDAINNEAIDAEIIADPTTGEMAATGTNEA